MQAVKTCETCGIEYPRTKVYSQRQWAIRRFCSRPCFFKSMTTGRRMSGGYIQLRLPEHPLANRNGWVNEHRVVVHAAGIDIPRGHHVHHKDGDKTNNKLENLEVLPGGVHSRLHSVQKGFVTNKYGTFPVLTDPDERRARETRRCVAYQRRRRLQESK